MLDMSVATASQPCFSPLVFQVPCGGRGGVEGDRAAAARTARQAGTQGDNPSGARPEQSPTPHLLILKLSACHTLSLCHLEIALRLPGRLGKQVGRGGLSYAFHFSSSGSAEIRPRLVQGKHVRTCDLLETDSLHVLILYTRQCRDRWLNHLDPRITKGDWTEEEDRILGRDSCMQPGESNYTERLTR
jgi:hypothetical protein